MQECFGTCRSSCSALRVSSGDKRQLSTRRCRRCRRSKDYPHPVAAEIITVTQPDRRVYSTRCTTNL